MLIVRSHWRFHPAHRVIAFSVQPATLGLENGSDVLNRLAELPGLEFAIRHVNRLQSLIRQHRQDLTFSGPQKQRAVFPSNLENGLSEKDGQQVREEE